MQWSEINVRPDQKTLRQFALLWIVILSAIAAGQELVHGRTTFAMLLGVAAAVGGLPGLLWPATIRWLFVALTVATFPIGWLVSWLLFAVVYYFLFTPIALCFRIAGRDPLCRRFAAESESYWKQKPRTADVRRYFRQF